MTLIIINHYCASYIGIQAVPAGQIISFSKLKNLLQQVHGYVENKFYNGFNNLYRF